MSAPENLSPLAPAVTKTAGNALPWIDLLGLRADGQDARGASLGELLARVLGTTYEPHEDPVEAGLEAVREHLEEIASDPAQLHKAALWSCVRRLEVIEELHRQILEAATGSGQDG